MRKNFVGMDVFSHLTVFRMTVLLTFFLFAECAAGSCLSYGHSCWGAHGKRSGNDVGGPKYPDSNRLLLVRLMQQNANQRGDSDSDKEMVKEYVNIPSRAEVQQLLNEVEMESNPLKGRNEYETEPDVLFDEIQPLLDEVPTNHLKTSITRRISPRILKKRSTKMT